MTAWSGARRVPLVAILLAVPISGRCQPAAPDWAERLVREVRSSSYPELARKDIRIAWFTSRADYFQARFSLARFLTGRRMRYVVRVNRSPVLLDAPAEARRAIVAHELAHI